MDSTLHLLIEFLCVCGIISLVWYIINLLPAPAPIKLIMEIVVCVFCIIFLAHLGGVSW